MRDQQALHQLLANQRQPPRTQRAPDGDLLLPRRRPRHHQVGHVQAADQQHAAHSAQQDDQWLLHILCEILDESL